WHGPCQRSWHNRAVAAARAEVSLTDAESGQKSKQAGGHATSAAPFEDHAILVQDAGILERRIPDGIGPACVLDLHDDRPELAQMRHHVQHLAEQAVVDPTLADVTDQNRESPAHGERLVALPQATLQSPHILDKVGACAEVLRILAVTDDVPIR